MDIIISMIVKNIIIPKNYMIKFKNKLLFIKIFNILKSLSYYSHMSLFLIIII